MKIKKTKEIEITQEMLKNSEKQITEKMKHYDYDTVEYPIEVIVQKYHDGLENDEGDIYIPEYQREYVWSEKRKSKFIESVILGIPIPYIFFADVDGRYEIVDGSQRVRTLHAFLHNKFVLQDLDKLTLLNGFYFKDLSVVRQRRIKNKSLKMIALSEKTDPEARFDLFERINTGSDELEAIEIRKGLYSGKFYDFITECSENELFKKLCPISEKRTLRSEPQELILRFFAYSDSLDNYKGKVSEFIDDYIKDKKNNFDADTKESMQNNFVLMLEFVEKNFEYGFAKTQNATSTPRVRFEAIAVGINLALQENPNLKNINTDWLDSDEFKRHTTSDSANTKRKLNGRIDYVKDKVLGN
ncbi:MAG: DUF262 domain-containing protein [Campylobacterota bacterium]|nr:DUF262 domain-containing protein [Campylobacterota bacterium]